MTKVACLIKTSMAERCYILNIPNSHSICRGHPASNVIKITFACKIKARKKVLRQVFWLSGLHHFASLPEFTLSGKEIQNDSLITAAGAAPELKFAS
jgi:hypothetical protein